MIEHRKIRSTTILGVRSKGNVAVAGDGQVTLGDMAMKQKAVKLESSIVKKGCCRRICWSRCRCAYVI